MESKFDAIIVEMGFGQTVQPSVNSTEPAGGGGPAVGDPSTERRQNRLNGLTNDLGFDGEAAEGLLNGFEELATADANKPETIEALKSTLTMYGQQGGGGADAGGGPNTGAGRYATQ